MNLIKNIIVIIMLTAIVSCASNKAIVNRDTAYLSAKSIPPLQIPPGLNSDTISQEYPVSNREYSEASKKVNLTPPELYPAR